MYIAHISGARALKFSGPVFVDRFHGGISAGIANMLAIMAMLARCPACRRRVPVVGIWLPHGWRICPLFSHRGGC